MVNFPKKYSYDGTTNVFLIVYNDKLKQYDQDASFEDTYGFNNIASHCFLKKYGELVLGDTKSNLDDYIDSKYLEETLFPPSEPDPFDDLFSSMEDDDDDDFSSIDFGDDMLFETVPLSIELISCIYLGSSDKVYGGWRCDYDNLNKKGKVLYNTLKSVYGNSAMMQILTFIE